MAKQASSLSTKNFQSVIASGRRYVPDRISKELKSAGLSGLLHQSRISRQQALKALNHLLQKGLLEKYQTPTEVYKEAALQQHQQDLAEIKAQQQKHIRANIMIDITEELAEEEKRGDSAIYDSRGALGKKRVIDEIEQERKKRDRKRNEELTKRDNLTNPKGAKAKKPDLADLPQIKDLEID